MSDVINLNAEDNRNIIDDDAVPALTLANTNATANGGGIGLKVSSTADHALEATSSGATTAPVRLVNSTASGVLMEMAGGLISTASLTVLGGVFPVRLVAEDKVVYLKGWEIV